MEREPDAGVTSRERLQATLRRMALTDLDRVMEIEQGAFSMPWSRKTYESELTGNPFSELYVAEMPGAQQILGYLCLWIVFDELHLMTLAIHVDYRRRGIGEELVRGALARGRERGTRLATLEVRAGNAAARELYQKLGFSVTARRPDYYREPREDALIMTLEMTLGV